MAQKEMNRGVQSPNDLVNAMRDFGTVKVSKDELTLKPNPFLPRDASFDSLIDGLHQRNRLQTIEDAQQLSLLDSWVHQGGAVADPDSIVTAGDLPGDLFADDRDNGTAITAVGVVAAAAIVVLLSFFAGFIARGML